MKMNKVELTNVVEVTYFTEEDKDYISHKLFTTMVHVPEESLPPMSEEDKKCGGRLLTVYFEKAAEILKDEIGPITIFKNRFIGTITVVY